jgi:hypothetical protein
MYSGEVCPSMRDMPCREDSDNVDVRGVGYKSMDCINLSQDRDWWAPMSIVMNLQAKCW